MTTGGGKGLLHLFPRGGVRLPGGTFKPDDSGSNVEAAETERIVEEQRRIVAAFGA